MATRFLDRKTHRFYFVKEDGEDSSYVLIFGDEVETLGGAAPSGPDYQKVRCRRRLTRLPPIPHLNQLSI